MMIPRYSLLFLIVLVLQAPVVNQSLFAQNQVIFTHGPMLGKQTSTSMGIWARTKSPSKFYVRFGTSADQLDQKSGEAETTLAHDNTGVVYLKNLTPDTKYYYQLVAGSTEGKSGSFKTIADSKKLIDPELNPKGLFNFSFEFACGNNQSPEHGLGPSLPTYDSLLNNVKDKVDFAILNGDWLYEEDREYPKSDWLKQVGITEQQSPNVVNVAPTITGVWENYKTYLTRRKNLAEWHRHVPTYYTFDDHEILNDVFGCGTPGFRHRRTVFRDIGVKGWYDYLGWSNHVAHPGSIYFGTGELTAKSDILVDKKADFTKLKMNGIANLHVHWGTDTAGVHDLALDNDEGDPNSKVYAIKEVLDAHRIRIDPPATVTKLNSYSIGRRSYGHFRVANCDFYLLDTRTHRKVHDIKNPAKPDVSMLGKQQADWLMDSISKSDADFFFCISSVNFMVPHVGGGGVKFDTATKDDAWTVFLAERERLINFWDKLNKPVFVLTGDLHNSFAIKVTDNVWEFASGPHNSVNHRPTDEGGRPANGMFKYGPRECEIRWSSYVKPDIPREERMYPHYCVVKVNNVFNNPIKLGDTRLIEFPHPQVIFQFYDGRKGELQYAESISTLIRD